VPHPPRLPLILAPTPLHRLDRLSEATGLDLWIKRDDLTGFAMGGNKGRKLEYLMPAALAMGADVVVSCGSTQSNFVRQLGAACSRHGLECVAAVMDLPYSDPPGPPAASGLASDGGNVLLDEMLGVELRRFPDATWEELYERAEEIARELEAAGKRVYRIPVGGSSPLGAFAFVCAAEEVRAQAERPFDWIVVASSSGSTQTGLAYGFHASTTRVLGICSDPEPELVEEFAALAAGLDDLLSEHRRMRPEDFHLDTGFVGAGYGVPSPEGDRAAALLAREEGVFLDPVYGAKAFAGLTALAERGEIRGRVLFWHTGGGPSIFAWSPRATPSGSGR
jgi:D-cysteine desulfhydrase family pyridoxal phosphate-dependent enzyme